MLKRIVGIAASVALLTGLGSQAQALAQPPVPIDKIEAARATLGEGMVPVGAGTAKSILTTLDRFLTATPRHDLPRPAHLVEGVVQPFLYDTTAADCLRPNHRTRDDSVGVAQAIAGPAVDTSLPAPVIPPGTVNVLFTAFNTSKSAPSRPDPMTVSWLNLNTMRSGSAPLIQERPAEQVRTLSNTIETGVGTVVFVVTGSVLDNTSRDLPPCDYAPVVGVVRV